MVPAIAVEMAFCSVCVKPDQFLPTSSSTASKSLYVFSVSFSWIPSSFNAVSASDKDSLVSSSINLPIWMLFMREYIE